MQIERDKVVTFHYSLTDAEGSFTEASEGKDPIVYLHGYGNIVPGLENELRGKKAGDTFQARIAPEHAYGMRDESAVQRVPVKHLIRPGKLEAGKRVAVNTNAGPRQALVLKVGKFNVDLDLNHPLAGKTLVFDVRILEVREATTEEIAHRHAHGPGGHH
ncbi:MAG TPA: peptidylprolyl isomerase [Gammaproteobacteria bacterium]|jgi:FKBP-type peptidyl-prolyl cis-trans isomerase SlyD